MKQMEKSFWHSLSLKAKKKSQLKVTFKSSLWLLLLLLNMFSELESKIIDLIKILSLSLSFFNQFPFIPLEAFANFQSERGIPLICVSSLKTVILKRNILER